MRKYGVVVIALLFLAYGGVRLGVSSLLILQVSSLIDLEALRGPIIEVADFMTDKAPQSLVAFSAAGYLVYLWVMGLALTAGAIACLRNYRQWMPLIASFIGLYALLFLNFMTINRKFSHLIVCAILFGLLVWLKRKPPAQTELQL